MQGSFLRNPHLDGGPFFWKAGPVGVLLLHGLTSTTAEVRPFASFLNAHGYTVAGPLLPGHGTQPLDLNRRKWQEWAASAEDAFQYLSGSCETVFVAGASMGGLLALYLASKQPEIKGLLLFAPALRIPHAQYAFLFSLFAHSVRKRRGDEWMPWQGYYVNPLAAVSQLYRLQQYVCRRLNRVIQPAIIFQGGSDQTIDPHSSQQVYDLIQSKDKHLNWYESCGHVLLLDHCRDEVQSLSLEFITKSVGD